MKIIKIWVTKKGLKTKKGTNSKDTCFIQDGKAVTRFGNPNDAVAVYQSKRKERDQGLVEFKRGTIIELHPEETKEAIRDHTIKFIENLKVVLKDEMDIQYVVSEEEI